ncbi:AhpC/TSA family protein [Haloferula chungangensis]|uniref:AhpC/TSA family protein n=1 Tax=Haloferula chungangensis TaxID=1048331 RepID=A0ABW2L455_9BACT
MPFECRGARCQAPRWITFTLLTAGAYHVMFGAWVNIWPHMCFDLAGIERPNHPALWRGIGLLSAALGIGFLISARSPIRHWPIVLAGFAKFNLVILTFLSSLLDEKLPGHLLLLAMVDDVIWWFPFAAILWVAAQAHMGRPPSREAPLSLDEAAQIYRLSSGETLAEASKNKTLAMVFLRHFGCTFTRQILRELQSLKEETDRHGARLVLVHMLEEGAESSYLEPRKGIARIADPMCELYRAFGLGKGGFFELFGPLVLFRMSVSLIRGCGVGHLAGDGLQMPGAFLFRNGEIINAQRAHDQSELPNLPRLFEGQPEPSTNEAANA